MELDRLLFLRAIPKGDFLLYIASIEKLLPRIFALDHIHYARWLTVHHYDMEMLSTTNPDAFNEFYNGNFTVKQTRNPFSAMGLDQQHEPLSKDVKGKLNIQCNNDSGSIAQYSVDINFVISIILCSVLKRVLTAMKHTKSFFKDKLMGNGLISLKTLKTLFP